MDAQPRGINRRVTFTVTDSLRARFTARIDRQGAEDCWQWLGATRNGYGAIKHERRVLSAHVVAWVLQNGPVPDQAIICHTCDNPLCCNFYHLYAGTPSTNVRDADQRRRIPRPHGCQQPNAVLNDQAVALFRSLRLVLGWGSTRVSAATGYAQETVAAAMRGTRWKHVPDPTQQEASKIVAAWKRDGRRCDRQGADQ